MIVKILTGKIIKKKNLNYDIKCHNDDKKNQNYDGNSQNYVKKSIMMVKIMTG